MKNFQQNAGFVHGQNNHAGAVRPTSQYHSQTPHGINGSPAGVASATSAHISPQNRSDNIPTHYPLDEELGYLFTQMRELTGADLVTLASHLQTTPQILTVFERGDVDLFPPWAETVRIVSSLTLLVNVDCDPILNRISAKTRQPGPRRYTEDQTSGATYLASQPSTGAGPHTATRAATQQTTRTVQPSGASDVRTQTQPVTHAMSQHAATANSQSMDARQHGRQADQSSQITPKAAFSSIFTTKRIGMVTVPLIMALAFFLAVNIGQKNGFTGPLGNYAKAGWELFHFGSTENGLRWINVNDPRSRKADKLPVNSNGY